MASWWSTDRYLAVMPIKWAIFRLSCVTHRIRGETGTGDPTREWTFRGLVRHRPSGANLKAGNLGKPGSKRYRKATEKPVAFRPQGAQPYDDRMLSWQIAERTVSVWTTLGRVKNVAFTASVEQLATLALYRKGESDLLERDGMWFLSAT